MSQPRRAAFLFVFFSVLLDMLALGIMVPVLPKLIVQFEGGNHALAAQVTGVFGFAWAAMQFLASPILGSLSDRFGRRPVLLLSSLGLGLDYVLMALAPNLTWLFVGRMISGVSAATFATASAYIADITPVEQRAGKFGMLGAAFGLGFIIGPAVGGSLAYWNLRFPFWASAAFCLANTLYGYFVLPESLEPENRRPFQWKLANPFGAWKVVSVQAGLTWLALAAFLNALAHESLPSMFVIYTEYRFHWDQRTIGLVLGLVGVCSMVVAAGVTRASVARLGETKTLVWGMLFGMAGYFCYGLAQGPKTFLLGVPLIGFMGMAGPALQGLMSRRLPPNQQGQLQGMLASMRGIAGMIGPLLFTQAFAMANHQIPVGIPYHLAGLMVLLGLVLVGLGRSKACHQSVTEVE